jgi:RHS repeat-associated protein
MYYDFNGNLTQISEGGQNTDLTWDVRDRLTNMTGPGLTASFAYDVTGRRIQKTINSQATTFMYDGVDMASQASSGSEVSYLNGLGIDEPLVRAETSSSTYYLSDSLGSTLALTDSGGTVLTSYTYDPFGQTTATGAASPNPFQYTGRENDGTGLYYYRARYYHPGLSRFISEDPLEFLGGGVNLYTYVFNNPNMYVDPLGFRFRFGRGGSVRPRPEQRLPPDRGRYRHRPKEGGNPDLIEEPPPQPRPHTPADMDPHWEWYHQCKVLKDCGPVPFPGGWKRPSHSTTARRPR